MGVPKSVELLFSVEMLDSIEVRVVPIEERGVSNEVLGSAVLVSLVVVVVSVVVLK